MIPPHAPRTITGQGGLSAVAAAVRCRWPFRCDRAAVRRLASVTSTLLCSAVFRELCDERELDPSPTRVEPRYALHGLGEAGAYRESRAVWPPWRAVDEPSAAGPRR